MVKQDLLEFKGKVTELLPNAMFRVKLENNHEVLAHTAGKLRKNRSRALKRLVSAVRFRPWPPVVDLFFAFNNTTQTYFNYSF